MCAAPGYGAVFSITIRKRVRMSINDNENINEAGLALPVGITILMTMGFTLAAVVLGRRYRKNK